MSGELNPDIVEYINNINSQLEAERTKNIGLQNDMSKSSFFSGEGKDKNVAEMQLNVEPLLDKAFHLLSGHEVRYDPQSKSEYWAEPEDDRLKIFSVYGVKRIMNILAMYLNINTLMAFYDIDTIKWKVRDFGIELSDLFLTESERILFYPTPEELFDKYKPFVKEDEFKITDEELYKKCIQWSDEELASKENSLSIICMAVVDMVHSSYMRAFQGKERQSLGERGINISQSNAGVEPMLMNSQKKGGFLGLGK